MAAAEPALLKLHLFEACGVELEYMLVHSSGLGVAPVADSILRDAQGQVVSDYANGPVDWSNELVCHVLELKTHAPAADLTAYLEYFAENVREVNARLEPSGCRLLGSAAHPCMNPLVETRIWSYEYNEVYELYNKIFDCRGHGWSNLQSTHLNLPFCGEREFGLLHTVVRLILPLIPALCASSPVIEGQYTGYADSRLEIYRNNQSRIPSIAGEVIPEPVTTRGEYEQVIFAPIMRDIAPYDPEGILEKHFLNSRGAIARFDRGSIEIRLMDIQEAPCVDLALCVFLITILRELADERWLSYAEMQAFPQPLLVDLLLRAIRDGEETEIGEPAFLSVFGITAKTCTASGLLARLYDSVRRKLPAWARPVLESLWQYGSLASRLRRRLGSGLERAVILQVYGELADCLQANRMWV